MKELSGQEWVSFPQSLIICGRLTEYEEESLKRVRV